MIVYLIDFPNGKKYVGATSKSLEERKKQHQHNANGKSDYPVHCALRKYGDLANWKVLKECDSLEDMYKTECEYIEKFNSLTNNSGYNVKNGGFYITGTHGKTLSQKRKEYFQDIENRKKHSVERGGKPFVIYDLLNREFSKIYCNQQIAAEDFNINVRALNNVLVGRAKQVGNFTAIWQKNIDKFETFLENLPKPFKVLDKNTNEETTWISKSECNRELGVSRATIAKALDGKIDKSKNKYNISYV